MSQTRKGRGKRIGRAIALEMGALLALVGILHGGILTVRSISIRPQAAALQVRILPVLDRLLALPPAVRARLLDEMDFDLRYRQPKFLGGAYLSLAGPQGFDLRLGYDFHAARLTYPGGSINRQVGAFTVSLGLIPVSASAGMTPVPNPAVGLGDLLPAGRSLVRDQRTLLAFEAVGELSPPTGSSPAVLADRLLPPGEQDGLREVRITGGRNPGTPPYDSLLVEWTFDGRALFGEAADVTRRLYEVDRALGLVMDNFRRILPLSPFAAVGYALLLREGPGLLLWGWLAVPLVLSLALAALICLMLPAEVRSVRLVNVLGILVAFLLFHLLDIPFFLH